MPKKISPPEAIPTLVQERLQLWGACIKAQRLHQQILRTDLCQRMGISSATLQRIESGDSRPSVGLYFSALHVLGVLDLAVPALPPRLWESNGRQRARPRAMDASDDDF